jgi:VanZ family protein
VGTGALRFLWIWGPPVAQMIAIFIFSSQENLTEVPGGFTDHQGHFIGYALLAILLVRALASATWRGVGTRAVVLAIAIALLYGASDEFHQRFVTGRSATVDDWIADALGAIAGSLAVLVIALVLRRRDTH